MNPTAGSELITKALQKLFENMVYEDHCEQQGDQNGNDDQLWFPASQSCIFINKPGCQGTEDDQDAAQNRQKDACKGSLRVPDKLRGVLVCVMDGEVESCKAKDKRKD